MTEPWPEALEDWEPELSPFARELAGQLSSLSDPVLSAAGPLLVGSQRRADEPDGYGALSRRGPYERLLISEWALQLEHPDEFLRRATSGEHLFVELERRSPATSLEAWLLLDTGPSQLGAPRLGQLAAILAFSRRAREAGVFLRWAPLWAFEQPEFRAVSAPTVAGWLEARTAQGPSEGVLEQWATRWAEAPQAEREVWLVGGPDLRPLAARRGYCALTIDDTVGDGISGLELTFAPAGRRRASRVQLALPDGPTRVRLLRNPFPPVARPVPAPAPRRTPARAVPLHPRTELAFSADSHRLLARTEDGSVVAIPMRNTLRASFGHPLVAQLPPRTSLVAVSWAGRNERRLLLADEKTGELFGAAWTGTSSVVRGAVVSKQAERPLPHELFTYGWPHSEGWEARGQWIEAASGLPMSGVIAARVLRKHVVLLSHGEPLTPTRPGFLSLGVSERPTRAWLGGEGVGVALCAQALQLELLQTAEPRRRTFSPGLAEQHEVLGLAGPPSQLVGLGRDGRQLDTLRLDAGTASWTTVTRARARVEAFACSSNGAFFAWRDEAGEIAVFSHGREELVLRLHVRDATQEVR